jgi:hypothetical protein
MVSIHVLLAAGLASLALAVPEPNGITDALTAAVSSVAALLGSFTVNVLPNGNFNAHGPTAFYEIYIKYGVPPRLNC